jgi:predicted HicB family RNase H-like nuclease
MLIVIREDLHRRLKMEGASQGTTVKAFVTEAIATALKKEGEKK